MSLFIQGLRYASIGGDMQGGFNFMNTEHTSMHASQPRIVVNKGRCACGNETLDGARVCGVCIMATRRTQEYFRQDGVDVAIRVSPAKADRKTHKRQFLP